MNKPLPPPYGPSIIDEVNPIKEALDLPSSMPDGLRKKLVTAYTKRVRSFCKQICTPPQTSDEITEQDIERFQAYHDYLTLMSLQGQTTSDDLIKRFNGIFVDPRFMAKLGGYKTPLDPKTFFEPLKVSDSTGGRTTFNRQRSIVNPTSEQLERWGKAENASSYDRWLEYRRQSDVVRNHDSKRVFIQPACFVRDRDQYNMYMRRTVSRILVGLTPDVQYVFRDGGSGDPFYFEYAEYDIGGAT